MSGLGCGPPSIDRSGQRPVQPNSTRQACVQGQARLRTHRDRACALLEMHGCDPASVLAIPFPANLAFGPASYSPDTVACSRQSHSVRDPICEARKLSRYLRQCFGIIPWPLLFAHEGARCAGASAEER
jgi:hypothetical protein